MKTNVIETVYTLQSPLSHIGETESTETFLNTIAIRNGDTVEDVFAYSGNAIRGAWRDAGAVYLLEKLGGVKLPKKIFHLLFSGGNLSGAQVTDIEQAKRLRDSFPFISIFGGGVGNQILSGKITQTFAYPVCKETTDIIPSENPNIDYSAQKISWRRLTGETSFTRTDDSKDVLGDRYIGNAELIGNEDKKTEEASTQMRYTTEYLIPGTQLWHRLELTGEDIELGALVASLDQWSRKPNLGGMSAKGFGLVDAAMTINGEEFININKNTLSLSKEATRYKGLYDNHLKELYDHYLVEEKDSLIKLLEG